MNLKYHTEEERKLARKQYSKTYNLKHKDEIKERRSKDYKENPEKHRAYKEKYLANPLNREKCLQATRVYLRKHRKELGKARKNGMKKWLADIKKDLKCKYCPENHPSCLVFHHTDPSNKKFNISNGIRDTKTKKQMLEEIAKCDVVCSNCHLKFHFPVEGYLGIEQTHKASGT